MDGLTFVVILIAVVIQCFLLMWVVSSATETKRKLKNDEIQIRLLSHIAQQLGVPPEQILKDLE